MASPGPELKTSRAERGSPWQIATHEPLDEAASTSSGPAAPISPDETAGRASGLSTELLRSSATGELGGELDACNGRSDWRGRAGSEVISGPQVVCSGAGEAEAQPSQVITEPTTSHRKVFQPLVIRFSSSGIHDVRSSDA